jgi:hypothetical protein
MRLFDYADMGPRQPDGFPLHGGCGRDGKPRVDVVWVLDNV